MVIVVDLFDIKEWENDVVVPITTKLKKTKRDRIWINLNFLKNKSRVGSPKTKRIVHCYRNFFFNCPKWRVIKIA